MNVTVGSRLDVSVSTGSSHLDIIFFHTDVWPRCLDPGLK